MRQGSSSPFDPPPILQPQTGARRILLVDDDHSLRNLMTGMLKGAGHQVDAAENGLIAWDILQHHAFDLLLTDFEMPLVSGVDLVKKLRAARMDLPVVLVSGRMPTAELSGLPWLHLAATLAKPFTGEQLVATVNEALRWNPQRERTPPPQAGALRQPSSEDLVL